MTKLTRTLLVLSTMILAACRGAQQSSEIPLVVTLTTAARPCLFDYREEWQYVAGSQARELDSGNLRDEATAFAQNLTVGDPVSHDKAKLHMLQHPDSPETIIVEYDLPYGAHYLIDTLLLRRGPNGQWEKLSPPSYPGVPGLPVSLNIDLMGFVWECDGWSLYVGARNTEFYSGMNRAEYTAFYQSRDSGWSWKYGSHYGLPWSPLSAPETLPSGSAVLATGYYDREREQLTRFAWVEETRTLHAFTYPFVPTPTALPTP
jgi:hypothetical protein